MKITTQFCSLFYVGARTGLPSKGKKHAMGISE
jgi:hypothetical protein